MHRAIGPCSAERGLNPYSPTWGKGTSMDTSSPPLFHLPTPLEQERRAWTEDRWGYLKEGPLEDSRLEQEEWRQGVSGTQVPYSKAFRPWDPGTSGEISSTSPCYQPCLVRRPPLGWQWTCERKRLVWGSKDGQTGRNCFLVPSITVQVAQRIKVGDGGFKKEDRLSIQNGKEEMFSWLLFGTRQPCLMTFLD